MSGLGFNQRPSGNGLGIAAHAAEHAALTYKIPYILAQSAVPVCLAPNGTVATNGVVTLGTALPTTYSGGIWLRLPANAIVGGLAGLYWAVMSSTTQGQVYTNFADPATAFLPSIPSGTLVAAVGSNSAYTQTTGAAITLASPSVPGGSMGLNGGLRITPIISVNNSAGVKTLAMGLGVLSVAGTASTVVTQLPQARITNRGAANSQILNSSFSTPYGTTGNAVILGSVNTAAAQLVVVTGNLATATDYVIVEALTVEVLPS